MMVVLRLRNLDPVSIPHSACDELRFQTWPTPFEVYTCQTHDFLPSFEQPSYILVNSSILSPISPGKEFGPPFQSPLQPGIRHGTWSSSIRCIPMNLLFRSEQGEETSFFFFFWNLAFCWCRTLQKCVAFEGGSHSPVVTAVTAVSSSAGWGGSGNPSHGNFLIRPVLQHGFDLHSWKLSLEPLLQPSPEFPELCSIIVIHTFFA